MEVTTKRTASVWVTVTVVLDDDYPGDFVDLQNDVARTIDDTEITNPEGTRRLGVMAVANATASNITAVPVD